MIMIKIFLAAIFGLYCFLLGATMPDLANKKYNFSDGIFLSASIVLGIASLIGLILL